jgi:hypothetical protein
MIQISLYSPAVTSDCLPAAKTCRANRSGGRAWLRKRKHASGRFKNRSGAQSAYGQNRKPKRRCKQGPESIHLHPFPGSEDVLNPAPMYDAPFLPRLGQTSEPGGADHGRRFRNWAGGGDFICARRRGRVDSAPAGGKARRRRNQGPN